MDEAQFEQNVIHATSMDAAVAQRAELQLMAKSRAPEKIQTVQTKDRSRGRAAVEQCGDYPRPSKCASGHFNATQHLWELNSEADSICGSSTQHFQYSGGQRP